MSVIAGVTFWNFYFQIFEETIRSEQIIEFLQHLLRHIQGDILLIWDRLPAHRSRSTQQFLRRSREVSHLCFPKVTHSHGPVRKHGYPCVTAERHGWVGITPGWESTPPSPGGANEIH